jgi:hypothetical protein
MTYYTEERFTRLDYCQFLLSSQINFSLTHLADHARKWSHDTINSYLKGEKITPRLTWEKVKDLIIPSGQGYVVFDDTVADKNFSRKIETVRRQWSGNAGGIIRGIGIVTCVYVNPEREKFWIIDYRIFDPDTDGKSKLDHLHDMLTNVRYQKKLPFHAVLMDTWYATLKVMRSIEKLGKIYYCPIKKNRLVDESDGADPYKRVENLSWSESELDHGKSVHLKKFPKGHRLKLFRLAVSTSRTDYVVTNDITQHSADETQKVCGVRWKIEAFHREAKQVTGIERCQCLSGRIQRNHIGCAMLVWARLKEVATQLGKTIYQAKFGQLSDYLIQQLKSPSIRFA